MSYVFQTINEPSRKKFALFNLGFRVFFLSAIYSALILIVLWILMLTGAISPGSYYGSPHWHSHEMLFGYTAAVIAGFLLTAVRNWTNVQTITGNKLALLSLVWLLGRISPFVTDSAQVIITLDLMFYLGLIPAIAHPIIKAKQYPNMIMLVFLVLLLTANVLMHAGLTGNLDGGIATGISLAVYTILALLTVITGRVMPFFTRAVIPGYQPKARLWLDILLLIMLVLLAIADIIAALNPAAVLLAAVLTALHIFRVTSWFHKSALQIPILWVLYLAYLWLVLGFGLKTLALAGLIMPGLALHAWTVGAIGLFTYGMMARVSLGHTGRMMQAPKLAVYGFITITLAGLARVFLPMIIPGKYMLWLHVSGSLWSIAFLLLAIAYTAMLIQPRADGMPG